MEHISKAENIYFCLLVATDAIKLNITDLMFLLLDLLLMRLFFHPHIIPLFVVQSRNVTPWAAACQASLSFTISRSLLKLMSIESAMPSKHLILCCPLLLLFSLFPRIRVFSNELTLCIKWPKYWSLTISSPNEYSRLISFRIDWFDLLVVQGILKSLLQHHNSKASILQYLAFFMVQLWHPYTTTRKAIALTIRTLAEWCLCFLTYCLGLF